MTDEEEPGAGRPEQLNFVGVTVEFLGLPLKVGAEVGAGNHSGRPIVSGEIGQGDDGGGSPVRAVAESGGVVSVELLVAGPWTGTSPGHLANEPTVGHDLVDHGPYSTHDRFEGRSQFREPFLQRGQAAGVAVRLVTRPGIDQLIGQARATSRQLGGSLDIDQGIKPNPADLIVVAGASVEAGSVGHRVRPTGWAAKPSGQIAQLAVYQGMSRPFEAQNMLWIASI